MEIKKNIKLGAFGNGLKVQRLYKGQGISLYVILRSNNRIIAYSNVNPIPSYEDSGYFPCLINGGKNIRYMDGEGVFAFGIYGKNSRPYHNKRAKVELEDGSFSFLSDKGKLLKRKFEVATDFIYPGPSAKVVFQNEEGEYFIASNGNVLDLSFLNLRWFETVKEEL